MIRGILLLLLLVTVPGWGQIQNYWGIRGGTTLVVQDNYTAYTGANTNRLGWLLAVSRTLPLADWRSVKLVLEGQVQYSTWDRYLFHSGIPEYNFPYVEIHEFVFAPLFIHSVPVDQARFFVQAGPEIAWVGAVSGTSSYDKSRWKDFVLAFNIGGGVIIPATRDKEIVLDIRYNSDITAAVDGSGRNAPVGTRFDEVHLLLGVNFSLDDEGY